jgi:hypothetical protein
MKLAVALLTLAVAMPVMADNDVLEERSAEKKDSLGLTFEPNERLLINAWLRGQFRYSDPFDSDPKSLQDYAEVPGEDFEVRRGRIKVKGHLFNPKIGFYYEHELTGDHPLLDLRLDIHLREDIELRVGQHKVLYNRERVDSSGKQQFVERSISTYAFTVDRQVGATFLKKFMPDTKMNNLLFLGVNKGNGRGGIDRRNGDPMYLARWQWHFLGEELPFSQSDLKFREVPAASLSFAAAQVRGPFTRFSSSGGGQLDGFEDGGDKRYTLQQFLQEFAWHYDGMSIQQEFHIKKIEDHEAGTNSTLEGGYAQFGKLWEKEWFGRNLPVEAAVRVARVSWDTVDPDRVQDELTLVGNLFFAGHNNKLSADISQIKLDNDLTGKNEDTRFRLQWDVSF